MSGGRTSREVGSEVRAGFASARPGSPLSASGFGGGGAAPRADAPGGPIRGRSFRSMPLPFAVRRFPREKILGARASQFNWKRRHPPTYTQWVPQASDLLLAQLALEGKLITSEQLAEGIASLASGSNGTTMQGLLLDRGWVKPAELQPLLDELKRRQSETPELPDDKAEDAFLARILVKQGLTTDREVRDCLRMQEEMSQLGKEVPRLGFLLYRNGYLRAETNLKAVLICKECASRFAAMAYDPLKTYLCKKCNGTLTRDTKNADDTLLPVSRRPMPDEVALAMKNPSSRFANGKYILIRELGRGGVGVVWKAWQTDLERFVAIKQMSSDLWGESEIKRFFREAQTAASLSHTNIATIYEVGVSDSKHWVAMEYIDGDALSAFQFRAGVGSKLGDTRYGSRQGDSSKPSEPPT